MFNYYYNTIQVNVTQIASGLRFNGMIIYEEDKVNVLVLTTLLYLVSRLEIFQNRDLFILDFTGNVFDPNNNMLQR